MSSGNERLTAGQSLDTCRRSCPCGQRRFADHDACPSSVLDSLAATHPALERRVRDETGRTRVHVNLFVDDDNIRDLDGVDTTIADGSDLSIIPAISGG